MKVILKIGTAAWLVKDAISAAKVAELLGSFQPIKDVYGPTVTAYYPSKCYHHEVRIAELIGKERIVKTHAEAERLAKQNGEVGP